VERAITRQSLEHALRRILRASGLGTRVDDVAVAVTQYSSPLLFAIIVPRSVRDVLSQSLMELTGRRWALHWDVWILNESDARMLVDTAADGTRRT